MQVKAYEKFRRFYLKLPLAIRKKIDKQIKLLANNVQHPSLRCKKIQGREDIWEARVDEKYRMTFDILGDTIYLRVVGDHDKVLKNP